MSVEKNIIASGQMSHDARCAKRRSFSFITRDNDKEIFKKTSVEKDVLLNAIYLHWNESQIKDALTKGYEEKDVPFPTEKTKNIQIERMTKYILRYVNSEHRTPLSKTFIKEEILNLPGLNSFVSVSPDIAFYTNEGLEVIKFKTGKATNWSHSGNKKDLTPEKSLELYCLYCYARNIAPAGKQTNIKASYYFLKSKDDFSKTIMAKGGSGFEPDFFTCKDTVYSLNGVVDKTATGLYKLDVNDYQFKPQLEIFDMGEDESNCTTDDCKYCDMNAICHFNHAPIFTTKEKKVISLSSLKLTKAQQDVINFREGYARCNAGAGAGKTLVVALRVVMMLEEGIKPEHILLMTFTNAGAGEMKDRVKAYIADEGLEDDIDVNKLTVSTFNAFTNDIDVKEYKKLGFTNKPRLIDEIERTSIIRSIADKYIFDGMDYANFLTNLAYSGAPSGLDIIVEAFRLIKANNLTLGDEKILEKLMAPRFLNNISLSALPQFIDAYSEYDALLKQCNLIEYADQELLFFELLRHDPYYLEQFGYEHIIVDEFQDTSAQQVKIIKECIDCPSFKSLMVVGDDSQAIYSFRDTSPEHIINFFDEVEAPEKDRHDFYLVDNHRCTPEIISLANKINAMNVNKVAKDLLATRPSGKPVTVKGFYEKETEYDYIISGIKEHIKNGVKPENIAVLGADRNILTKIASLLAEEHIPAVNMNPEPVLENSKVIAGIELAKAIANPDNTKSIMIYLNAKYENTLLNFSEKEIEDEINAMQQNLIRVHNLAEKEKDAEFFSMLNDINYDSDELYEDFIEKLKYRKTFDEQLNYIQLFETYGAKQTFKRDKEYPGVVLTTMHSSKGLEWPIVYMTMNNLDKEGLHHAIKGKSLDELEEKRRLIFVSITRAKDELYITGQFMVNARLNNQFLKDIFHHLGKDSEYIPIDPDAETKKAAKKAATAEINRKRAEEKAKMLEEAKNKGNLISANSIIVSPSNISA